MSLLCVVAGTLTKWTAPAFFYLTVIPLLAWRRQLSLLIGWRHLLCEHRGSSCAAGPLRPCKKLGGTHSAKRCAKKWRTGFAPEDE